MGTAHDPAKGYFIPFGHAVGLVYAEVGKSAVHHGQHPFDPIRIECVVCEEMIADPRFVDLAVDDAVELDAGHCHLIAGGREIQKPFLVGATSCPAGYHHVPFGYLVLHSEPKLGASTAQPRNVPAHTDAP